jgi:hypothetical protein
MPSLRNPLLKLEWAGKHLKDLEHGIGFYGENGPAVDVDVQQNGELIDMTVTAKLAYPPPLHDWMRVLGDLLTMLTALNFLIYQLSLLKNSLGPRKTVTFHLRV